MHRHKPWYENHNSWVVEPSRTRLNFSKPEDNEYYSEWINMGGGMCFVLVKLEERNGYTITGEPKTRLIVIAGAGHGYGNPGESHLLVGDQSRALIGTATIVAEVDIKDVRTLKRWVTKPSVPLYTFQ
jgi:hypothetical protein